MGRGSSFRTSARKKQLYQCHDTSQHTPSKSKHSPGSWWRRGSGGSPESHRTLRAEGLISEQGEESCSILTQTCKRASIGKKVGFRTAQLPWRAAF